MSKSNNNNASDKKNAFKKYLTQTLVCHLINNTHSVLEKGYWKSYHCMDIIMHDKDGRRITTHCKNRWCSVCNSVRTAKLIKTYAPQLQNWSEIWFVTLTLPNCTAEDLSRTYERMKDTFRAIVNVRSARKRHITAIRKFECTLSQHNDFHPHYHLLVEGEDNARYILEEWLKRVPEANSLAQDIRKADMRSTLELFKYFTKLFAKDADSKRRLLPDPQRIDWVFQCLRGKHTITTYGGIYNTSEDLSDDDFADKTIMELANQVYEWQEHDWVNCATGEVLTGYEPSQSLIDLHEQALGK